MDARPDIPAEGPPAIDPHLRGNSDAHIAILLIAGIVVMFLVGFLLLVFAMASDWT